MRAWAATHATATDNAWERERPTNCPKRSPAPYWVWEFHVRLQQNGSCLRLISISTQARRVNPSIVIRWSPAHAAIITLFPGNIVSDRPLKIMIVDDHTGFRGVIRAILHNAGWQCIECQDGLQAVEQYARSMPDLVLMDICMEGLDGLQATTQIKASFPAARIMILTQHDDSHLRSAAVQAGACGYILKEDLLALPGAITAGTMAANNQANGRSSSVNYP